MVFKCVLMLCSVVALCSERTVSNRELMVSIACNIQWLTDSNNSSAVQAIGSIAQAFAAFLTFVAMIYLGIKQNKMGKEQTRLAEEQKEMTRRQVNLSLYEKRYKIYKKCLEFMNQFGSIYICYGDIQKDNQWKKYQSRVRSEDLQFYMETAEKEFLFDDELVDYINHIETMVGGLATISDNEGITAVEKRSQEIRDELSKVKDKFKIYLDFRNI